jgi:outer membrane protein, multidrug efflux system
MRNDIAAILITGFVIVTSVSCSHLFPEKRSFINEALPETYSLYTGDTGPMGPWWGTFQDAQLDAFIRGALSTNFSLKEARARLEQVRASAVKAGAAAYPTLNASTGASVARQHLDSGTIAATSSPGDYSLALVATYEIDLWGRIRSGREAARLEANASHEDLSTAAMSIAAEVADLWIRRIAREMDIRLLKKQLATNQMLLELVELRFRKAMVSALDVYQQRQVVEKVRGMIPLAEAEKQLSSHNLALLMGKSPRTVFFIERDNLPEVLPIPPTGLPAHLLANRPDIRSAGLRLQAADWQVAEARAKRLPDISLTGTHRYGADNLDLFLNNWIISLAGNLVAPILDGNSRKAEVDRTRAVVDEKLAAYERTVLNAVKEVEDALVLEVKQGEHIVALEKEIHMATAGLNEATSRYRKGLSDYLPVLTQLLAVQNLERDLIQKKADRLITRIGLHRALGGSWIHTIVSAPG